MEKPCLHHRAVPGKNQSEVRFHENPLRNQRADEHPPRQRVVELKHAPARARKVRPDLRVEEVGFRILVRVSQVRVDMVLQMQVAESLVRNEQPHGGNDQHFTPELAWQRMTVKNFVLQRRMERDYESKGDRGQQPRKLGNPQHRREPEDVAQRHQQQCGNFDRRVRTPCHAKTSNRFAAPPSNSKFLRNRRRGWRECRISLIATYSLFNRSARLQAASGAPARAVFGNSFAFALDLLPSPID